MNKVTRLFGHGLWAVLLSLGLAACGGGGDDDDDDDLVVTTINITPTAPSIAVAATQQFTATVLDQNGDPMAGVALTWDSSDDGVATITNAGVATGVSAGTTNITAAASGVTSNTAVLTVTATATLSGTAATGAPIAGATVTIKDSAGTTRSTTTAADGTYTGDVSGLVPPFLVQVALGGGGALFSVSNADDPDVVNVHPLTDLIIRAWYQVQGTTVETAFTAPVANPPPTPAQVEFIAAVVETVIQTWLTGAGLDPDDFDLIATPFDADGTGFDGVLDDTTVNAGTGEITIDDGTTNQTASLDADDATDTITVDSTITGPGGSSSSSSSSVIPADDALAAALQTIAGNLDAFGAAVGAGGATLADDDLLPFFAQDALDQGLDRTLTAGNFASFLRGATAASFEVERVVAADVDNGVIEVELAVTVEFSELTFQDTVPMSFHEEAGDWRLAGDQHAAESSVHFEQRIDMFAGQTDVYHAVNVDVRPLVGAVTAISVTGGGVFNDTDVPFSGQVSIDEFEPAPGETVQVQRNAHFLNTGELAEDIPPGTEFTLTLDLAGGGTATITETTGGATDEVVTITSPTQHTLAAATLGQPLTVQWTLPTTFALRQIQTGGQAFTAPPGEDGFSCDADAPEDTLPLGATQAEITFPTTCNGEAVVSANINISFNGVNGERIQIIYSFQ